LLLVLAAFAGSFSPVLRVRAEQAPDDLFQIQGYSGDVFSSCTFPSKVHILSLSDVGNYRLLNHTAVVQGALEATQPIGEDYSPPDYVNRSDFFFVQMDSDYEAKLKVDITCSIISDWASYRDLVDSDNNSIIVNTHDEYLPVPSGYSKEEWTAKIADFMLNRWGTWVHVGGYPFYRVWYENGTTQDWGQNGFQQLMGYIGRGNIACELPPGLDSEGGGYRYEWTDFYMGYSLIRNWVMPDYLSSSGFPLKDDNKSVITPIFGLYWENVRYCPGAILRFGPFAKSNGFGSYVHLSAWRYADRSLHDVTEDDHFNGLVATAAAIYNEFDALRELGVKRTDDYETSGALGAIERAANEGRIRGLDTAQAIYQLGLSIYGEGNYKLSRLYAATAGMIANNTITPVSEGVVIVGFIVSVPLALALLIFHRLSAPWEEKGILVGKRIKWWLQFLMFSEPEQRHQVMRLEDLGSVQFSLITAVGWLLGPFIVAMGTMISYNIDPSFTLIGLLLSIVAGVLTWLEFLHILYDRPAKQKPPLPMTARYNASLNIYVCPKCLFPLDGNGGTCKVCGGHIESAEQ